VELNGSVSTLALPLPTDDKGISASPDRLIKHEGRLFLLFSRRSPVAEATLTQKGYAADTPKYRAERCIARLYPDRPSPIGSPIPLSASMISGPQFLDGDSGFVLANGTQRSLAAPLLDLVSANRISDTASWSLYRMRLPE